MKDNSAVLLFNQLLGYKSLNLLNCAFTFEDDERVKQHIKYRHKLAKVEYQEMETRLLKVT